jgi:RimJ/RimL family protein N-acetyltransferase
MCRAQPGTPGAWFQLAIERQAEPGLIGDCAFQILRHDERQAQIGFTLARPYQRQGYAAEAVRALLDFLFSEYQLHRITAVCDALNLPSARLLERLGMRREGHYLENVWFKGRGGTRYAYAILRGNGNSVTFEVRQVGLCVARGGIAKRAQG